MLDLDDDLRDNIRRTGVLLLLLRGALYVVIAASGVAPICYLFHSTH